MKKWRARVLRALAIFCGCVIVLGLVGVFLVSPVHRENPVASARTNARVVRTAIQQWQAMHGDTACPTIAQVVQEKHLDPGWPTVDPWNKAYRLHCTDDEVTVRSAGVDKQFGTSDDIVVPRIEAVTGERRHLSGAVVE
jgi:hypothetical protein